MNARYPDAAGPEHGWTSTHAASMARRSFGIALALLALTACAKKQGQTRSETGLPPAESQAAATPASVPTEAFSRYVEAVRHSLTANFEPPMGIDPIDPALDAAILVQIDVETGSVESWSWMKRSGAPAWDQACERSIEAVPAIQPPPEDYRHLFEAGFVIRCVPDPGR